MMPASAAALLLGSSVETNMWTMARKQGASNSQGAEGLVIS